jgi:hypothetical protein
MCCREVKVPHWTKDVQANPQKIERDKNCISRNEELVHNKLRWTSAHVSSECVINGYIKCFCRDGSDALGNEGKDMGSIVLKLRNVAQGVGKLILLIFCVFTNLL